jgi:hypothetical protein
MRKAAARRDAETEFRRLRGTWALNRKRRLPHIHPKKGKPDLVSEIDHRLEQLEFILQRIDRLQRSHHRLRMVERSGALTRRPHRNPDVNERRRLLQTELTTLCEAFYYLAWRVVDIVGFDCRPIRQVRNQLIEHPAGADSRAVNWNFVFGLDMEDGPIIKPLGPRGSPKHPPVNDAGLYANARAFVAVFSRWVTQ